MKRKPNPSHFPKAITPDCWWYEDRGGITVVQEAQPNAVTRRISWSQLLKAAKRCGKV